MKTEWYFRQLGEQTQCLVPTGKAVITGHVEAWTCHCYHVNHITVPRCNNCGGPKPAEQKREAA